MTRFSKMPPPQSGFGLNKSPEAESAARLQWDGRSYSYGAIYRDVTRPIAPRAKAQLTADALFNPLAADQRTLAERQWTAPAKAPAAQRDTDGLPLFGDRQGDLF